MKTKIIKTGLLNGLLIVAALMGLLVSQVQAASTVTYYHHDALGSKMVATDETGQVVHWNEEYQPYGEKIYGTKDSSSGNQDWFTGKNYDEDLDLTYFGASWYDAKQGRFLSTDPTPVVPGRIHTFNRYHYANNNPYKFVDPDGRASLPAVGRIALTYTAATTTEKAIINAVARTAIKAVYGAAVLNVFSENVDGLSESGKELDPKDKSGELTKAGRGLQKHGSRSGSAFPPATGNAASKNDQGQEVLDDILTDPGSSTEVDDRGRTTVTAPDGRSARFNPDGSMQGFREPESKQ